MADTDEFKAGSFYWVLITYDVDTEEAWVNEEQPARYIGGNKWNLLGTDNIEWPVRWVGEEINKTA